MKSSNYLTENFLNSFFFHLRLKCNYSSFSVQLLLIILIIKYKLILWSSLVVSVMMFSHWDWLYWSISKRLLSHSPNSQYEILGYSIGPSCFSTRLYGHPCGTPSAKIVTRSESDQRSSNDAIFVPLILIPTTIHLLNYL